jgi:hypothetical protein
VIRLVSTLERHRSPESPVASLVVALGVCAALAVLGFGMAAAQGFAW